MTFPERIQCQVYKLHTPPVAPCTTKIPIKTKKIEINVQTNEKDTVVGNAEVLGVGRKKGREMCDQDQV